MAVAGDYRSAGRMRFCAAAGGGPGASRRSTALVARAADRRGAKPHPPCRSVVAGDRHRRG